MTSPSIILGSTIGVVLLAGCMPPYVEMAADGGGTGAGTSTTTSEEEQRDDARREPKAEAGDGDGDGSPHGAGFIQDPDGGGASYLCDLMEQDCPEGEKCNLWANDGGGAWNATKCVPIDPDPDDIGEPCSVAGNAVTGVDSCVLGAICWNVDSDTNLGDCVGFCTGGWANPTCPDPSLHCVGRDFLICLPGCCPLLQDCPEGEACYATSDTFDCAPDVSGEQGQFGDACEYLNVCDAGLFCANADAVPGCADDIGCCTPFCDAGDPDATANCPGAAGGQECVPWYEEGHAPPGEENVGACLIPT